MKLWWSFIFAVGVALSMMAITARAEFDLWEEADDDQLLVRSARGTKERASGGSNTLNCRYIKGQWSECDPKTNMRSRTMNLKKGDSSCEKVKTMQKKCKKSCRYEKGTFSSCVNLSMTRIDNLKPNSDPTCDQTRRITKKCKQDAPNMKKAAKAERANKKTGKQ